MTDLSLVPYAEIEAEIRRRFPASITAVMHPVDGKPGVFVQRVIVSGEIIWCLGLSMQVSKIAHLKADRETNLHVGGGSPPVDPPNPC